MEDKTDIDRLHEVDGIRGWAALLVLFAHFFGETFGVLFKELHNPITDFLFEGRIMVYVFFVLSGDALSNAFFRRKDLQTNVRLLFSRYPRLTLLIFVSCFLSWLAMKLGLNANVGAAEIVHRGDWLGTFLMFTQTLGGMLKYAFAGVYFGGYSSYNPFLWTMAVEMAGSLLVFLIVFCLKVFKEEHWTTMLLALAIFLLFLQQMLALFVIGVLLARLRTEPTWYVARSLAGNAAMVAAFVGLTLLVGSHLLSHVTSVLHALSFEWVEEELPKMLVSATLVVLIYKASWLKGMMSTQLSRALGKLSFPIYALQFNVLTVVTCNLIVAVNAIGKLDIWSALAIGSASILGTIVVGALFLWFVTNQGAG